MRHNPEQIWADILSDLSSSARNDVYLRQAKPTDLTEGKLTVTVPAVLAKDQIESRFLVDIDSAIKGRIGLGASFDIEVKEPDSPPRSGPGTSTTSDSMDPPADASDASPAEARLNSNYTFKRFVIGTNNRLSHAAALAVSENPGTVYNPLFFCGGVGLGKTHLLHAIGNRVHEIHPELKVLYVTSETFMNEYIDSIIVRSTSQDFRGKYRTADVLLIDDIQFLQRKDGTQEEFFHTFNELHQNSNQVVMTSDRPPKNLEAVEERLRSRFEWGMVAEISTPQFETRVAILRQKCEDHGFDAVPDPVLNAIADVVQTNIRELEGALLRLVTEASLFNEQLTEEFTYRTLGNHTGPPTTQGHVAITAEDILKHVGTYFRIKPSDLKSARRTKQLVIPRQIGMYLCRTRTSLSYSEIAAAFGRSDHTTVMHACDRIANAIERDAQLNQTVNTLIEDMK
ncbi:MAG: chromosomal replication initiator protein DnaA [Candidatus Poribacteria bacterium]|nr:chromosomal replication initiator protein DnaA [Candidatus Poribacteria bacterium]MDE0506767.1 chromosomal replication initiator protein DnaA [Candidatus Poribacteria bacterium]